MNAPVHRWVDLAGPVHYVEYTHDVDPAPSAAPPIVLVHGWPDTAP